MPQDEIISNFLTERLLQRYKTSPKEVAELFLIVERDLKDAKTYSLSADRRFATAYNAALQLATVVLYSSGYKTTGQKHHFVTFKVLPALIGNEFRKTAEELDKAREKRNQLDYDQFGKILPVDLNKLLQTVEFLKQIVGNWMAKNHSKLIAESYQTLTRKFIMEKSNKNLPDEEWQPKESRGYRGTIIWEGKEIETLLDILPKDENRLDILFVGKTPALNSVKLEHYFQGTQGKQFWSQLIKYKILKIQANTNCEDENLLVQGFGITDVVKKPLPPGNDPSPQEYREGSKRLFGILEKYKISIIVFVYKKPLDKILKLHFKIIKKANYGFNPHLDSYFRGAKIFSFPLPGVGGVTREEIDKYMKDLKNALEDLRKKVDK